MKVVTIVGARPQFIKVAPVSRALELVGCAEVLVHTGQHYDANMSDVFFHELGLQIPAYKLDIVGRSHGAMTGEMLTKLEPLLQAEAPDVVLVYGDTNSTLAGALAAAKLNVPVAHVEAGLRSFNRTMPEEQNRILTDHLSQLLFTPTSIATQNLHREGIIPGTIHQVGDVMFDASLMFSSPGQRRTERLERLGLGDKKYALATIHRAENTDDPIRLAAIFAGLDQVCRSIPVVLPLHPRTSQAMQRTGVEAGSIRVIDPVGYLDMLALEGGAEIIVTDSGGVQKEAYFQGVPCVTLRDETEWPELIESGWNKLVPPLSPEGICEAVLSALGTKGEKLESYGDGRSSDRIASILRGLGT